MVVLVLIGIITSFAVLSTGGGHNDRLVTEARRLAALMELTHQEAILRSEQRGVRFTGSGYAFSVLDGNGKWQPVDDSKLLSRHELPAGFSLQLQVEGRPVDLKKDADSLPQVLLLSSGEATDFALTLSNDERRRYTLSGDLTGKLELQPDR
jgi:general secretion pathway protein H